MSIHRLEHQENGQFWCEICRDVFETAAAHEDYTSERQFFDKLKAETTPPTPQQGFTPERREALQSFIGAMDELLEGFERDNLDHVLDVHAVDFRQLERTIRENPQLLQVSVDLVMNQQHLAQKALAMGEPRFVPNAYLIATIYCIQEIDKIRRNWKPKGDSNGAK